MKRVLLVRHAKSDWNDFRLSDHDRPLNERGKKDAPEMAEYLNKKQLIPDGIYTSTARRAKDTAMVFATTLSIPESHFFQYSKLYHPTAETILDVIQEADDRYNTIGIFCHNPGVTYFTNNILDYDIDEIATCGIVYMSSDSDTWSEISKTDLKFEDYFYPKM
jgi:phosphohistidine phosphatase